MRMRHTARGAFAVATALAALIALAGSTHAQTLRVNIPADPAMVNPITYSELVAGDILDNVYEGFTGIDENGDIVPELATSWEAHDDGLGFRFHLREGVKFHSGRPFTAEDVKYTFERLLIPGNKGGLNARYLDTVEGAEAVKNGETTDLAGVEVVDDHTLDVRFTTPDVLFPIYPFYIMDSGVVEAQGETWHTEVSAGTGPFKFEAWDRGSKVSLLAHEDYWGGAPAIDGVDFLIVPEDSTAISMFQTDELDVAYLDVQAARRALETESLQDAVRTAPAAQIQYLGMNQTQYEPFKDIRVREAICISLDRDAMIEGLYGGAGFHLYGQITPGVAGYNPDIEPIPFDLDHARELMAEAGYPDGEGMPPVNITSTPPNKNELAYYANQLKTELGIPVEVQVAERGSFIKNMNAGEVAFFPWGWTAGYPDALYFLSQVWYGPSPYNRARWQSDEYDALIEKAEGTADAETRYDLYHQAEQVLMDDWGTCPVPGRMQVALVQPNVEGVQLTPFRFLPYDDVEIE